MTTAAKHASIHRGLSTVCDALTLCIIMVVPLLMGGRHPLGKLVYVTLVAAMSVVWVTGKCLERRGKWRWSGAELLLVLAVLLVALQLAALPASWIAQLSPQIERNLPLWSSSSSSDASLGSWSTLSLTPEATRQGLAVFLAHGMLFGVLLQRLNRLDDIERLLKWIAVATIGMAALGLAQYLFGNGKFLWVYEHPSRTTYAVVKGTFANQNHFAHFVALGLGPVVWWMIQSWDSVGTLSTRGSFSTAAADHRGKLLAIALAFSLGTVILAGALSFSRGGLIVLLLALVTCVAVFIWRCRVRKRPLQVLAVVGCMVGLAICIHGADLLGVEIGTMTQGSIDSLDQEESRRRIWTANIAAIRDYFVAGTGIGSHREVYPTYFEHPAQIEYTHAESGYLQVLLEAGLPGLLLLLSGVALCGFWCVSGLRRCVSNRIAACFGAVVAGLVASAVHSVVDFVWYLAACMSLVVMLAACACRLFQIVGERESGRRAGVLVPRGVWIGVSAATVLVGIAVVHTWLGPGLAAIHWDRYLAESFRSKPRPVIVGQPLDGRHETQLAQSTQAMKQHLERALRWNRSDARANLRMAGVCLRLFEYSQRHSENAMGLSQIRDAAVASRFATRRALDAWLAVAIGDNRAYLDQARRHARRALRRCPLQGEGYVYLAELAFLEGLGQDAQRSYVGQALKVRPYSGPILFAAGREAILTGHVALALHLWQQAFHQDRGLQSQIIAVLAPQMPASALFAQLQPDVDAAELIFRHYQSIQRDDQANAAGHAYVAMLEEAAGRETGAKCVRRWRQAYDTHWFLKDYSRGIVCLNNAVDEAPNDFRVRYTLAAALYARQEYARALTHLQWCARRKPHDQRIGRKLRDARARMGQAGRLATSANRQDRRRAMEGRDPGSPATPAPPRPPVTR